VTTRLSVRRQASGAFAKRWSQAQITNVAGIGYDGEARIREFYRPNDHKVVFWKSIA
jgi:hypothetical protein